MKNLWSSRFKKEMNQMVEEFNASITFDKTLYRQDIRGSIAHATMLQKMGHLSPHELEAIVQGLSDIEKKITSGQLKNFDAAPDVEKAPSPYEQVLISSKERRPGKKDMLLWQC